MFATIAEPNIPPEEAQKLFVEVTVKMDNTEELDNLYQLARRARQNNDAENAAKYYHQILSYEPDSWEATFFSTLCRSSCDTIANIAPSCDAVRNCLDTVFQLIADLPADQQKDAVQTVVKAISSFANTMFNTAIKHHCSIDPSVMSKFNADLQKRLTAAAFLLTSSTGKMMGHFEKNAEIAPLVQIPAKTALEFQGRQSFVPFAYEPNILNGLFTYIGRYDPTYVENYKKKQNSNMLKGGIILLVLGAIALVLGFVLNGVFLKTTCYAAGGLFLILGIFRLVVLLANKKLNG